jgi:riboflavin kinase / FMN adenylyltransferase
MAVVPLSLHEKPPEFVRGGVVAVGNFDGVHRGHAALIAAARELAGPKGMVVPVTFDPHPLVLLDPERYQPPLTTIAERARLLHEIGVDHVVVLKTTHELLSLSPLEFFGSILTVSLVARGIVEGFNFRFGKNREGSNKMLMSFCYQSGMAFREVPAFEDGGRPVSSSRVREALEIGDVATAAELLNRPYRITGVVGTGAKRGRTIGFPTANLEQVETLLPAEGVYAVRIHLENGIFAGAANIGPNPTFVENARKIEVHLIDFSGDLYGQSVSIDFVTRLRETRKFAGVDALVDQLRRDVAETKKIFGAKSKP